MHSPSQITPIHLPFSQSVFTLVTFHSCDQMLEQKQLKGGSVSLGSLFDMISSIKEGKAHTGAEVAGHIYITGQETESRQDMWLGSQISRPSLSDLLPPARLQLRIAS